MHTEKSKIIVCAKVVVLTNSDCPAGVLEARAQRVPQVEQLVGEEQAVVGALHGGDAGVDVGTVGCHTRRPALQKPFQLVIAGLPLAGVGRRRWG